MSFDIDRPVVNITTGPSADAPGSQMHVASFDLTSGELVRPDGVGETVMEFFLQLHTDMFLVLPGMLFLGLMGFLGLVAALLTEGMTDIVGVAATASALLVVARIFLKPRSGR